VRTATMKLDADEKELLDSVERGEWKSAKGGKRERARYSRYAKATFRKDRRLNIRLVEQGFGGNPQTCTRGGAAVSDLDRQLAAQVRGGTTQGDLRMPIRRPLKWYNPHAES
jgi:hypothetical protein